jgi:hypothetical protein
VTFAVASSASGSGGDGVPGAGPGGGVSVAAAAAFRSSAAQKKIDRTESCSSSGFSVPKPTLLADPTVRGPASGVTRSGLDG